MYVLRGEGEKQEKKWEESRWDSSPDGVSLQRTISLALLISSVICSFFVIFDSRDGDLS